MILNTLDQFKAAIPTALDVDKFEDLNTFIESGESWIKLNVLGRNLYDALNNPESTGPGADENLLQFCRKIIANHAYWDAIPFLDLVHTNSGFGVITANGKAPASKERVERLREQCLIRRDAEVEYLIDYLEDNSPYHDLWKGSGTYTILSECLIQTSRELQQYAEWHGTRAEFLKMKPRMVHETITRIEPVLSKDLVEELIERQRDDEMDLDMKRVTVMLKQALGCIISGKPSLADKILQDAVRYMDDKQASFVTYFESKEYLARSTQGYINEADSTIFSSLF